MRSWCGPVVEINAEVEQLMPVWTQRAFAELPFVRLNEFRNQERERLCDPFFGNVRMQDPTNQGAHEVPNPAVTVR